MCLALFKPVHRQIRQNIGHIALGLLLLTVDVEQRIDIHALPAETYPLVESRPRLIRLPAHVPLAQKRRLVSRLLEILREKHRPRRDIRVVVNDPVPMRQLARQDRRPARRTQRRRDKRILEVRPLVGHPVQVRRLEELTFPINPMNRTGDRR